MQNQKKYDVIRGETTISSIEYVGIKDPQTPAEIEVEINGLLVLISEAQHKIASLKQALSLLELHKQKAGL